MLGLTVIRRVVNSFITVVYASLSRGSLFETSRFSSVSQFLYSFFLSYIPALIPFLPSSFYLLCLQAVAACSTVGGRRSESWLLGCSWQHSFNEVLISAARGRMYTEAPGNP